MNNAFKLLLGLGAAIAVGTALGVLYAPEEGVETRKKLVKKGRKLVGAVNDSIDDGRESLEEIKEVLQRQINKVNRRISDLAS